MRFFPQSLGFARGDTMTARLRSWWQKRSKPLIVGAITILVVGVLALVLFGYLMKLAWTGFLNKTLWDWLQLLIIPLVLAVAALLFNLATTRNEQKIALDKQREDLLQTYIDRMSELLLKEQLRSSAPDAEVRNVARVRTTTILFQLDARRIEFVFAFLRESGLMSATSNDSVVSLSQANLRKLNLSGANLYQTNFSEAILFRADLRDANLIEANLSKTILRKANLSEAILRGADLSEADLSLADLSGAEVTTEQLDKAKSLQGATMPDGSIHP
jgi:Pentapeptide repeats (8 copies)